MTTRQKLILFLISCEPGIRDIYKMIRIYDRADFPAKIGETLKPLLDNDFIFVSQHLDNGTPSHYQITEEGKKYINLTFNETEIISYINTMHKPDHLLEITQMYINKRNSHLT